MAAVNIERRADCIGRVAINRPDKRNALNDEVRKMLIAELPKLIVDAGVHAIVLTGEGGHFCAGGDIASMEGLDSKGARARICLLYTSPSPRDLSTSRMPSSA